MCGIVGYCGNRDAISVLIPALRRLEYRGYDSAGVATVNEHALEIRKAAGKIADLEAHLGPVAPRGNIGIAHTRWATHGEPSRFNAHPHVDCELKIAIVHNGIIENSTHLRRALESEGHRFRSQTDSEVIAHLIERHRTNGLPEAVMLAAREIRGACALACIADNEPDRLVAVRRGGSPLVIGRKDGEVFLASDIPALLGETKEFVILEEGEMAILARGRVDIRDLAGRNVQRPPSSISMTRETAEKGGYPHFMLKEIFEQPEAVRRTIADRIDLDAIEVLIPELEISDRDLVGLNRLDFVACGTSWHAAMVGRYLIESFARLPVEVEIASEFRYRDPVLDARVLTVPISQSGETADTLAALRRAKRDGSMAIGICNVMGSSLSREADGVLFTRAGIEIGVASTKAFTAQVAAATLLAVKLGLARGFLDRMKAAEVLQALTRVPELIEQALERAEQIREISGRFVESPDFLFLGRNLHYPMALEGALKLKEISYIHAEGYPAGEMKHGPIALVNRGLPVVAITPQGPWYEKMASNIEEVLARDGVVIPIGTSGDDEIARRAGFVIEVPPAPIWIQPILVAVPLQLLAYHLGTLRGCDVDQPRNLAKSVTVE
jgi:glucosamine--fructose-6-phosphate aminotransferase (isomerizing)